MATTETSNQSTKIPRDRDDDYTPEAAEARQRFVRERTGVELEHVPHYSFDPKLTAGNVEQFVGVAQVPIGLAGPVRVNGEHAQGDFYVPLATAEGTLVASYNRGMKLVRQAGGVTTTIMDDAMRRGPAFVFTSARERRRSSASCSSPTSRPTRRARRSTCCARGQARGRRGHRP